MKRILFLVSLTCFAGVSLRGQTRDIATGFVFNDENENGRMDPGEKGIPDVLVSNQIRVIKTDGAGRWELPVRDDCVFFVIKPRNWKCPLDENNLPRFYYINKPNGSPELKYAGVPPTGDLPESIDFPLYPAAEPDRFQAIFFGDPQPRDQKELDYIAHDVVEDLIGTRAAFGVTLGDILFDDLSLYENSNRLIGLIGVPWYNVIGNHDMNYDSPDDKHSDETYEKFFGPNYYAFEYGPVWFVVLDNVVWGGAKPEGSGAYQAGLGGEQLAFLNQLIPQIPETQLVVFMMHIPLFDTNDREALFRMIENRPYTLSISGHTHWHAHRFLGESDGWRGSEPHHHVVNVTVCGSWWTGEPDEVGIPHTTMRDGAPNGYSIIHFDGVQATLDFHAARRPADYQMNVFAPERALATNEEAVAVYVNVFNGSEKSTVRMRLDNQGEWRTLKKVFEEDPYFLQLKENEAKLPTRLGRDLPEPVKSHHLWKGSLPARLPEGVHVIHVETTDMHGRTYSANRTIRVTKSDTP